MLSKQILILSSFLAFSVHAAVTEEEAKALGTTLTPWGAEVDGNLDGTIPAYTGEISPPPNYDPSRPAHRPDPFGDSPLYTITKDNMEQYSSILTDGFKAMLKKYPDFRMDVYETHRTARFPDYFQERSIFNAANCKAVDNGLRLEGCMGGVPFPIAKTGNEAMWNHLIRWGSPSYWSPRSSQFNVDPQGRVVIQTINTTWQEYPMSYPEASAPATGDTPYWMLRQDDIGPARKAGGKIVFVDHLDSVNVGRRVLQYIPAQRRAKLAPDLAYDTPSPSSGGTSVMDEQILFMGAQDRYDFSIVGKKEMLIPYNAYKLSDPDVCPDEKRLTKNFINPDCVRFELHRVWVVEAKLKPGQRHVYPRRMFYFDEDRTGAGVAENYDAAGELYRMSMTYFTPMYETPDQAIVDFSTIHDMTTGSYYVNGDAPGVNGWRPGPRQPPRFFTGDALTGSGVR